MSVVNEILKDTELTCIDAGAAGGLSELKTLRRFINLVSFEPLKPQFEKLKAGNKFSNEFKSHTTLPVGLYSSKGEFPFYTAENSSMSSILEFDDKEFDIHFGLCSGSAEWKKGLSPVSVERINTVSLDEFTNQRIDFLKLDTQGTELEILKGAANLLNNNKISVIKTEFSIIPVYKNQCIFSELDNFLKAHGFILVDCIYYPETENLSGKTSLHFPSITEKPLIGAGGDAVYVLKNSLLNNKEKLTAGSILCAMGYFSVAMNYLNESISDKTKLQHFIIELAPGKSFKQRIKKFFPPVITELYRKFKK
jgi:FkbM family methyltransferase